MWANVIKSDRCLLLAGRLRNARKPRDLTPTTSHNRLDGKLDLCSSTNINLIALGPQRTAWPSSGKQSPRRFSDPPQFVISLSSLRSLISRQSRSFSLARSKSSFDTTSVSRCAVIHLFSVDMPTPRSSATCLRASPHVNAIRTASARNSSVRFSPLVSLLCCSKCYLRSGIKPRQVQTEPTTRCSNLTVLVETLFNDLQTGVRA